MSLRGNISNTRKSVSFDFEHREVDLKKKKKQNDAASRCLEIG